MAKMIQIPYDNHIVLPARTAQAVQKGTENPISLEALGLLTNLLSYPSTWELHKTELYTRFAHNGRTSVSSAWNSLVKANYIIEFKYRVGKKYEYVYYFRKVPFSNEEKVEILEKAKVEHGEIFGLPILNSPNSAVNKKNISKKKNIIKNNIVNKEEEKDVNKTVNNDLNNNKNNSSEKTLDELSNKELKTNKQALIDVCNKFYKDFAPGRWNKKQWNTLIQNYVSETLEKDRLKSVRNVRGYLRKSIEQIAHQHDWKNGLIDSEFTNRKKDNSDDY